MNRREQHSPYFDTFLSRTWSTRLWAAAGAIALNLALFGSMPHLLAPVQARPAFEQLVSQVNFIRLEQPETPVKRTVEELPQPPPESRPPQPTQPIRARPFQAALTLPFEINPRLPASPQTLSLPPLPAAAFDTNSLSDIFSVSDLDAPLTILARIPPVYPMRAKHRGIEGWVRVRFVINEDGSVSRVTVVESDPPDIFDQSVMRCVNGWRFQPATVEGMPVKTRAETTVRFKLE
jgi:periplasmic protein TonB